ncbi:MAG: metallopeptidase TldD-related protein [Planctomycetota bacterium]|nr:metallopeptidase TldD-related protein [Planctomycetota bacterium]
MREAFYKLVDEVTGRLRGAEVLLAGFSGEESDFVRFNKSLVRQAGHVQQRRLTLELIDGNRHVAGMVTLTGEAGEDQGRAARLLEGLREAIRSVPEDPYLLYNTEPRNTEQGKESRLPGSGEMVEAVLGAGRGLDLVGILASGGIYGGFGNSLGQRNWFDTHSFHLDWCFYHAKDKAVKTSYAGFEWDGAGFGRKVAEAKEQLGVLAIEAKTIEPGEYRVYLAPAAMNEVMQTLGWVGFGLKAVRTKTTSLLKMVEEGRTLSEKVTLRENTAEGLAANFFSGGFLKPGAVTLIERGKFGEALASPRSAKEYGVRPNGNEFPESLDMAGGDIAADEVLNKLGTGVYVNRLWYLNYSDRPACRMTGMTRFATFWVEGGRIVAPLNVMRFDETIYRMLGANLVGLTAERDLLPSESTYKERSTSSSRLPGALVERFAFTL